jgi:GMP synthase (glutamine-hydrolysing)
MPGETTDSQVLAYSEGCPRQIIRYAPKVYGFQCHLEITREDISKMIDACPEDFRPSQFTQIPEELLSEHFDSINNKMMIILNNLMEI